MSLKFLGFLLAFLLSVVFGKAERLGHECVSRREFEERLGQLESRLYDEIKLRQKLEAEVEDMRTSLEKTIDSDKMSSLQDLGMEDVHGYTDGHELSEPDTEQPDALASSSFIKPSLSVKTTSNASTHSTKRNLQRKTRSTQDGGSGGREAFTVELVKDLWDTGIGQIIRFDNVVSQLGNGFDLRTVVFQAELPGWYVFSLTMMVFGKHEMELHVMRDGVTIARCWNDASDKDSTTQMVVTHLNIGTDIWIQTNPTSSMSGAVTGEHHTIFTGFLLYTDH